MQRSSARIDQGPPLKWLRVSVIGTVGAALLAGSGLPAHAGDPVDFSGTWQGTATRTTILSDDRAIPFTAKGRKHFEEYRRRKGKKDLDFDLTTSRCSTPGVPRIMLTQKRMRIFQDPHVMMMGFEWNRVRRAIGMPGLPPQFSLFNAADDAKLVGTKMGTSRSRWEGATLVIVTKELSDGSLLDDLVPHSFDLTVTERLSLKGPDTLEDRITIEDPSYFTRPFETILTYKRQPDAIFPEDVCLDRLQGKPPLPTQ